MIAVKRCHSTGGRKSEISLKHARVNRQPVSGIVRRITSKILPTVKRSIITKAKIVFVRQCVKFLRRCMEHKDISNFIKQNQLCGICAAPEDSH
ncbi:hypothetical protein KIN20_017005 [Parelaphostrongylus tenuis]|uniref:Uncharacterized protein n=1 Tax=Parelaphostrongylus tenuis TaxID=148309 RepID=A0AAD5QR63_PARTN|nr:hypothetical protein KIN20_017005 [Parelaphostrongylus tenuis]